MRSSVLGACLLVGGLVAAAALSARADTAAEWICDGARNNAEHIQCADREFRKHDAEMLRVYNQLVKTSDAVTQRAFGPPPRVALKSSQAAWLAFRDANCHWKATAFYGGSAQSVIRVSCLAIATRDRVEELKAAAPE